AADLKKIYTSVTLDEAEENMLQFSEKWRNQYPSCVKSWEENWEGVNPKFCVNSIWGANRAKFIQGGSR
ncbi:transposase, partial [Faecalibaculum rodentium]|uniref:transposase n=1 Tax=Faecalibaculum rodentium TaxID=1702221 RepID=UPI0026294025